MFKIYDGREAFYQWDINQKLIVDDDSITEVHFSNRTNNYSLVCDISNEGDLRVVSVPNVLLQTNWPIKVYAYLKDHTEVSETFKVIEKDKPEDYIYTPDEVKTWEELNDRITELEKPAESVLYTTWELINAIEIADGTEETNALTISVDKNGNAFSLKKARFISYFPKYTGESSIPGYTYTMISGVTSGPQAPLCYTSGLPSPNKSKNSEGWLEVDLSMPGYEVERVARFGGSGGRPAELMFWGTRRLNGAETITSIGGANMLIYPGCKFTLYGVRV